MHASDVPPRCRRDRLALDARQRRPIVAARADGPRAGRESGAGGHRRVRRRLRRGTLDAARRHRPRRAAAGPDGGAVHPLPVARDQPVRRAPARGAAQSVRRARRARRAMPESGRPSATDDRSLFERLVGRTATAPIAARTGHPRHLRRRRRPRASQAAARPLQPASRRRCCRRGRRSSASAARQCPTRSIATSRKTASRSSRGDRSTTAAWQRVRRVAVLRRTARSKIRAAVRRRSDPGSTSSSTSAALPGNRIYYLAVPPSMFAPITEQLAHARFVAPDACVRAGPIRSRG